MAPSDRTRYAPMSLALIAFIVTLAAVLYYGIAESPDHAAVERAAVVPPTAPEPLDAAAEVIALLRLEITTARQDATAARAEAALAREQAALAREQAALAREEATLARNGAAAVAQELVEVARRYEDTAARQETLEADLTRVREQPPRITVPDIVVQMAEPEVIFEPLSSGAGAPEPRVDIEQGEPRVRIEGAPAPARRE